MRPKRNISPCKYLQVALICIAPLNALSTVAAQDASTPKQKLDTLEFAIPEPEQYSSDSYDLLVLAGKNIIPGDEGTPATDEKLSPEEDLKRQRAFTQKNAASLKMMQEALQKTIVPPAGRDFDNLNSGDANSALRNLSRLAIQRNRVAAADEDWSSAINGALDIVQMGAAVGKYVGTLGMFNSAIIQNMARGDVWDWIEHSDAQTALQAAQRLEKLDAVASGYADVMREDKWQGLSDLKGMLVSPEWNAFREDDKKEFAMFFASPAEFKALRTFSDRDILRHYVETMDAVITQAEEPFQIKPAPILAAGDVFSAAIIAAYVEPQDAALPLSRRAIWEKVRVGNRALMTALALHAFHKDTNKYPEKLDELRGKYLQEVPRDPFGSDARLIYRRHDEKYTLYSVGPNGVDDGGVTIKDPKETRKDGLTAKGDLMVGQFK